MGRISVAAQDVNTIYNKYNVWKAEGGRERKGDKRREKTTFYSQLKVSAVYCEQNEET